MAAVRGVLAAGVVPAALELIDAVCLRRGAQPAAAPGLLPTDAGAAVIVEVDGTPQAVDEELRLRSRKRARRPGRQAWRRRRA